MNTVSAEEILYKHILAYDQRRLAEDKNIVSIETPPLEEMRKNAFFQIHIEVMEEYASQSISVSTKANGEAENVEALAEKILSKYHPATRTTDGQLAWTYDEIESAMVEMYHKGAAQSTPKEAPQNNSGLRWVKASERLPEKTGWIHVRQTDTTPGTIHYTVGDFMPSSFEWLDESGKEAPQVSVECYVVKELDDFPDKTGWYYVLNPNGEIMPRMIYFLGEGQAYWSNPTKINFTRWLKKTTLYTTK